MISITSLNTLWHLHNDSVNVSLFLFTPLRGTEFKFGALKAKRERLTFPSRWNILSQWQTKNVAVQYKALLCLVQYREISYVHIPFFYWFPFVTALRPYIFQPPYKVRGIYSLLHFRSLDAGRFENRHISEYIWVLEL